MLVLLYVACQWAGGLQDVMCRSTSQVRAEGQPDCAGLQAGKRKDMGACQAAITAAQALGVEMVEVEKHELNLACGDRPHQVSPSS